VQLHRLPAGAAQETRANQAQKQGQSQQTPGGRIFCLLAIFLTDFQEQDPYVFGPSGSGSKSVIIYTAPNRGPDTSNNKQKKLRKTIISSV
jgi:hypothetical protein